MVTKFSVNKFLVCFTILRLAFPVESKGDKNLVDYITQLANLHFPKCTLLVVQDNLEDFLQKQPRTVPILESTEQHAKYMINFRGDNIQVAAKDKSVSPVSFIPHLSNIHKLSDECMLAIIFVNSPKMDFIQSVKSLIAPSYLPVVRNDVDHYIFVCKPEDHQRVLKMPVFISKIKFKLAIGENSKTNQVQVSTIDYFGGADGTPKWIHLPSNIPSKKVAVFPDFFWNLHGYRLRVVYYLSLISLLEADPPPWLGVKNNARRGVWKYLFSEYLMIKFNFTYNWFPSRGRDGKMGTGASGLQMKNGTWVGVVGELYNGNADVGLGIASTDKRSNLQINIIFLAILRLILYFYSYFCLKYNLLDSPTPILTLAALHLSPGKV